MRDRDSRMLDNTSPDSSLPPRTIGGFVATTEGSSGDTGESFLSTVSSEVVVKRASILAVLAYAASPLFCPWRGHLPF